MINEPFKEYSEIEKNEAWDRLFRLWEEERKKIVTCKECGHVNSRYEPALSVMLTSTGRYGNNHKCIRCDTPMPWLDDRTYGVKRSSPWEGVTWGMKSEQYKEIDPKTTIWSLNKEK